MLCTHICFLPDGMENQVRQKDQDDGDVVVVDHPYPALLHVHVRGLFPFHVPCLRCYPFSSIAKPVVQRKVLKPRQVAQNRSRSGGKDDLELRDSRLEKDCQSEQNSYFFP